MQFFFKIIPFFILLLLANNNYSQEPANFKKLEKDFHGGSKIEEDNLGYLWITTNKGIYKFNGYEYLFNPYDSIFTNFKKTDQEFLIKKDHKKSMWLSSLNGELMKIDSLNNKKCFSVNLAHDKRKIQITSITPNNNQVWFGSEEGSLFRYNYNTNKIDSITSLPLNKNTAFKITNIEIINDNNFWVSTNNRKIYKYTVDINKLEALELPSNFKGSYLRIALDRKKDLWISSDKGSLYKYISAEKKYREFFLTSKSNFNKSKSIKNVNMIISLFYDANGFVWVGTDGDGLYKINVETNKLTLYKNNINNRFSLSNNSITNISQDRNGNLYFLDKIGIINVLPKSNSNIIYYNGLENNTPTSILSVFKSSNNSIWLGTDGEGLNRVLPNTQKIHYSNKEQGKRFFTARYIQSIEENPKEQLWFATYLNGLWVFKDGNFSKINTPDESGKNNEEIRFLFKDSKNRIWSTSANSFNVFSEKNKLLATFDYNAHGLKGMYSHGIAEDKNGNIFVVVNGGGLFQFNEVEVFKDSYFKHISFDKKIQENLKKINFRYLTLGTDNSLWLVLHPNGLLNYNIKKNAFKSFENVENLKDLIIVSVVPEGEDFLWLGTTTGIHKYNFKKDIIESFYQSDGLHGDSFNKRSVFKDSNGVLYFGGDHGVNAFLPEKMNKKSSEAKLYINYIEVLNKPATEIISNQLKNGYEHLKNLKLTSNQSSFSFQFSAIENLMNSNYNYAYKLEGFDNDWILSKKDRIATYTNIPSGNYIFKVKAGSGKGIWDTETKEIAIRIKPHWWKSTLAYIIYTLFFLFLIYSAFLWFKLKKKLIEETLHNNQEKEIYAVKMNFFAKMSHEIQTPLTLILGPIADMLQRAESSGNTLLKQRLQIIANNANRLSRIATELMTVRNRELGMLKVYASENDLIAHLKKISLSFSEQARFKKIDFIQDYPNKKLFVWYDLDKIEHVLYNLLSNAFKFTPPEGTVKILVEENQKKKTIKISISDSGPGIPEKDLKDIFKLFYQSDLGKSRRGTGIGLALTKELIHIHHGKIKVKSSSKEGTKFSISLSTKENVFTSEEKINLDKTNVLSESYHTDFNLLNKNLIKKKTKESDKKFTLLIVEDNVEMQIFLKDILTEMYNLFIAENGKQGIELAEKKKPDLIISDIMMPVMDGVEMCNILKKKKSTAHIPIIFLTAKNSTSIKIEGLESGAIEFLRKPFNFYELTLKIYNILESQEKLISKYKLDTISSQEKVNIPSKDVQFLESLVKELDKNIENPNFKLDELAGTLNMSYSVIYRNCIDITGKTLVEFLRSRRLKKAALLIVERGYNISEAAYMVGYKDSRYFTKCFKEEFGKTPKAFKTESQNTNLQDFLKKYKLS
ncbi:response regulator [Polaribacter batillariae]|uniref:histidine kinase n=1 Tax=Polaribacter batillariae TaxID=2808900 RepID=A0ABX7SSX0_9FLAO|nr:ATP-binding protein [Polaribacter batillariae]QTD37344.1 response regulator [Polaribacter batillariae]